MKLAFETINRTNLYRSDVFRKFIFSYLVVLIIPLALVGFLSYSNYNRVLSDRVGESAASLLGQVQETIDVRIRELNNMPVQIQTSPKLMSLIMAQSLSRFDAYHIREFKQELNSFKVLNDFIDNIVIFLQKDDGIIGTEYVTDMKTFSQRLYRYIHIPEDEFRKRVVETTRISVWPEQPVLIGTGCNATNILTYIAPLTTNAVLTDDVKLISTVRKDALEKLMLKVLDGYEGCVYVLDGQGNNITFVQKGDVLQGVDPLKALNAGKDRRIYTDSVGGCQVLISVTKSDYTGWNYMAVIPSRQVFTEVDSIRNLSLLILLFTIVLGTASAFYFSYKNYLPVRKIISMLLPESSVQEKECIDNEWDTIERQIFTASESKKALEGYITKQLPAIKSHFIRKLLYGDVLDRQSSDSMVKLCGMHMDYKAFAVMILCIDGYNNLSMSRCENSRDLHLSRFSLCNVAEEMCKVIGEGFSIDISDDRVAVMVCFSAGEFEKNEKDIKEIVEGISRFFKIHFDFTISVGIGNVCTDILGVRHSFAEASTAVEYKVIAGNSSITHFKDICHVQGFLSYYSLDDEKSIVDSLKEGNIEKIRYIIDSVVQKMQSRTPSLETVRCMYFEVISTAMRVVDQLGMVEYNDLQLNRYLKNLMQSETIDRLNLEVMEFYSYICLCITKQRENKNTRLAFEIREYVDRNLNHPNLSLSMVADRFGVSVAYVSRFFKDYFHYNFKEYIQWKRMEMAKRLLEKEKQTIGEIAREIGYGDVHSFIKVFKKLEGITPGQFREEMGRN